MCKMHFKVLHCIMKFIKENLVNKFNYTEFIIENDIFCYLFVLTCLLLNDLLQFQVCSYGIGENGFYVQLCVIFCNVLKLSPVIYI